MYNGVWSIWHTSLYHSETHSAELQECHNDLCYLPSGLHWYGMVSGVAGRQERHVNGMAFLIPTKMLKTAEMKMMSSDERNRSSDDILQL